MAATGLATKSAQDATPGLIDPDAERGPEMLFVQSFRSGSIVPTADAEGRYTLSLEHGLGQTIYFSDRPDRIVGASPTPQFLDGLSFLDDNPPNAALLVETADGVTDIAVVELFNPVYDDASHTATYEVAVLADWEDSTELGLSQSPADLAAVAASFGAAHLFIDGCPDGVISCLASSGVAGSFPSSVFGGFCYSASENDCLPCHPWHASYAETFPVWQEACNASFPKCAGACEPLGISRKEN